MSEIKLVSGNSGSLQAAKNRPFKNAFLKMRNFAYRFRPGEITLRNASVNYLDYMARTGQKFTGKEVDAVVSSIDSNYINTYGTLDMFPYITAAAKGKYAYVVSTEGIHKGEVFKVLDTFNSYGVASGAGHANRKIIRELLKTMKKGALYSRNFYNPKLAQLLDYMLGKKGIFSELLPGYKCYMLSSGSESMEAALKLACKCPKPTTTGKKRDVIIVMEGGFHGRTGYAMNIGKPEVHEGYPGIDTEVVSVEFGNKTALKAAFDKYGDSVLSVVFEPVQGETGVVVPPEGYIKSIRDLCNQHGALMIADEVQTFARTGKWFASVGDDLRPDILVAGKITSGALYPTTIIFAAPGIEFPVHGHGNTYTGSAAACTVLLETLKHIRKNNLLENSAETGAYLIPTLQSQLSGNPKVAEVRGIGAMVGIELTGVTKEQRQEYCEKAMLEGILITAAGDNALRMLLPLSLTRKEAYLIAEALVKVLEN